MAHGTSHQAKKGLKRSESFVKHFHKSINHVSKWSKTPIQATKLIKLVSIFLLGYLNVRLTDLKNCDLKEFSPQSARLYITILMILYIEGKAAKTKILNCTGLSGNQNHLVLELLDKNYIEEVETFRIQFIYTGVQKKILQKEIQLTTKGYDFLNQIFRLLVDENLL